MSFYSEVIRNSRAYRSDAICKDPDLLEPGTRKAVLALMDDARASGVDLRLLETYRSQTRQSALFQKHVTQLRTVGCHGYGVGADFGVFIKGVYQGNNRPYEFLREMARGHGLISGQDWGHLKTGNFVDSGHVQRIPVWRQEQLFSGSWYPPVEYNPYEDSAGQHPDVSLNIPGFQPKAAVRVAVQRNIGITATVFGGSLDPGTRSAYDAGRIINDTVLGVALPARLPDGRHTVRVYNGLKSITAEVIDIGPWNRADAYWERGARPQAETGTDVRGRKTNRAGIDLTPAAAKALGIDGKGVVDWEFV